LTVFVRINRLANGKQFKINYSFAISQNNKKRHLLRLQIGFCHFLFGFSSTSFQVRLRWTLLYKIHISPVDPKTTLYFVDQVKKFDSICSLRLANAAPTYRASKYSIFFFNIKMQSIYQYYNLTAISFCIKLCIISSMIRRLTIERSWSRWKLLRLNFTNHFLTIQIVGARSW